MWECHCDCGTIKWFTGRDINSGKYKSCGCKSNPNRAEYLDHFKKTFWSKTRILDNGCIEWIGNKRNGYGRIGYKRKLISCHRLVWEWEKGIIPINLEICHKCDNPSCVNIDHLFIGTHEDNMKDCVNKGRGVSKTGDRNPNCKIKKHTYKEIGLMLLSGFSHVAISRIFNVHRGTIGRIKKQILQTM